MAKGYVYVISNPCICYKYADGGKVMEVSPVKIGIAKDVEKRLGTLNTSLPENFVHHISFFAEDAKALENVVHKYLKEYRILTKGGESTEFFKCSVQVAVAKIKEAAKDMHCKEYHIRKTALAGRSACKMKSNLKAVVDKTEKVAAKIETLAAPFTFSTAKVPVGSKVAFVFGGQEAVVVDDKQVEFKGARYLLTGLAKQLMPADRRTKSGAYQGPKYFTYQGVRLTDLTKKSASAHAKKTAAAESAADGWKNVTQLAKWLAKQAGNEGAAGGICQLLSGQRRCIKTSKWRKPMEDLGIAFDKDDMIVNWKKAKRVV